MQKIGMGGAVTRQRAHVEGEEELEGGLEGGSGGESIGDLTRFPRIRSDVESKGVDAL